MTDDTSEKPCCCNADAPSSTPENPLCSCSTPASGDHQKPDVPCCGPSTMKDIDYHALGTHWISGSVKTPAGDVPQVAVDLVTADHIGTWKVRWGFNRMGYAVAPGLYAVGNPGSDAPVLVSANYKLSFDALRSKLAGSDAWILVLDTKAVNVWCAAGKGTFGTDEIVRRAESTRLAEIVTHRTLVVPQLGAPGVSAHEVKKRSGFRVVYGPVRAADLGAFLDAGMKATPAMREVRFDFRDRMVVAPVDFMIGLKPMLYTMAFFLVASGLSHDGFSLHAVATRGVLNAALIFGAVVIGAFLTPALLPWLPGRAFSVKGVWTGLLFFAALVAFNMFHPILFLTRWDARAWLLLIPPITSYLALNYTGTSTYTSLSGVMLETRRAIPLQIGFAAAGVILWFVAKFV